MKSIINSSINRLLINKTVVKRRYSTKNIEIVQKAGQNMEAQVKKEDRRVRRTKKLLTQALTELMQQKQVKEITVTELTDLADMNRGTSYLSYKDIFDMLEHIEDNMFQALNEILERHEKENVVQETEPILRDILGFIEENQEMVRVLLSPHGDMNFLHRLNDVLREKCLQFVRRVAPNEGEASFDYQYSFVIFGTAGLIRAWVNRNCAESTAEIAQMAGRMIRTGSLA